MAYSIDGKALYPFLRGTTHGRNDFIMASLANEVLLRSGQLTDPIRSANSNIETIANATQFSIFARMLICVCARVTSINRRLWPNRMETTSKIFIATKILRQSNKFRNELVWRQRRRRTFIRICINLLTVSQSHTKKLIGKQGKK